MRAAILLALGMGFSSSSAHAAKPKWGGFGYASQGFFVGNIGGLTDPLTDTAGEDIAPGLAMTMGGGGKMLLGGLILLSGRG